MIAVPVVRCSWPLFDLRCCACHFGVSCRTRTVAAVMRDDKGGHVRAGSSPGLDRKTPMTVPPCCHLPLAAGQHTATEAAPQHIGHSICLETVVMVVRARVFFGIAHWVCFMTSLVNACSDTALSFKPAQLRRFMWQGPVDRWRPRLSSSLRLPSSQRLSSSLCVAQRAVNLASWIFPAHFQGT